MMAVGATVLSVATARAGTVTTTTTSTSTTTTTLLGGCVDEATYDSIICRLDALVAYVQNATDLGRLKKGLTKSATAARNQCGNGNATSSKTASNQLKRCAHTLASFRQRLQSLNGRRVVPEATRTYLDTTVVTPLRSDVRAFRRTL